MLRKNQFVRMIWWDRVWHLIMPDLAKLQAELKRLYPTLVMFPYAHHFHELGDEPRRPQFIGDMTEHFTLRLSSSGKYRGNGPLALRVPWPDDIATGNPQRLIGRPHRRPFQDSKEAFRRFGRTVYFKVQSSQTFMMLSGITIEPPREAIAAAFDVPVEPLSPFRMLASLGGLHTEIPYDTEDAEVVAFAKSVASILGKLTVRTSCTYDGTTREPVFTYSHVPISKQFLQQCALEPDLHLNMDGIYHDHVLLNGPTPAQRRKWRREAGLLPEQKPAQLQVPKFLANETWEWLRENVRPIPLDLRLRMNKAANRAMYEYAAARTPGFERPKNVTVPLILPETDIWTKHDRSSAEFGS